MKSHLNFQKVFHFGSNLKKKVPNHDPEHLLLRLIVLRVAIWHMLEIWAKVKNWLRLSHLLREKIKFDFKYLWSHCVTVKPNNCPLPPTQTIGVEMVVERDYTSYGNYFVAICCLLSKTSSVSLLQWDEINSEVAL